MKNLKNLFALGASVLIAACVLVAVLFTPDSQSQITRTSPLPVSWSDITGSNTFGFSVAGVPTLTHGGVVYTGVTTNLAVKAGGGLTNIIYFVNGVATSIGIQ